MNDNLKNAFAYYRRRFARYPLKRTLTAMEAIADARNSLAKGSKYYANQGRVYGFGPANDKGARWIETPAHHGLRFADYSDRILDGRCYQHTGWFTDEFESSKYRGAVYQLPSRKGKLRFVAGYVVFEGKWPVNSESARIEFGRGDVYDCKTEAARRADGFAEYAASEAREYNEAWQAGARYLNFADDIQNERQDALALIREIKALAKQTSLCANFEAVTSTLRAAVRAHLKTIKKYRAKRAELLDSHGHSEAFKEGAC